MVEAVCYGHDKVVELLLGQNYMAEDRYQPAKRLPMVLAAAAGFETVLLRF